MKFSKDKFKKNAPSYVKRLLSEHLDVIDGVEVFPDEKGHLQTVYEFEGQEYYLYPIYEEWCE